MRASPLVAAIGAALVTAALSLGTESLAREGKGPRVSRCVKYSQAKGADEQSVDVGLANRCGFPVSCTLEWRVSCEGEGGASESAISIELSRGEGEVVNASAARCGDGDWSVDEIRWSCERL